MERDKGEPHVDASLNEQLARWFYKKYHYIFASHIKCMPVIGDVDQPNKGLYLMFRDAYKNDQMSYCCVTYHQENRKFKDEICNAYRQIMKRYGLNSTGLNFKRFVYETQKFLGSKMSVFDN